VSDNLLTTVKKNLGREGQAATDEIARTIIALTDVRLEACADEAIYKPQGAPVEAGLIKFLMQNDYHLDGAGIARTMKYRNSDETRKVACLPFDQALKRKVVIRYLPSNPDAARIYVQGAPEEVMDLCKYMHNIKSPQSPLPKNRQENDYLHRSVEDMACAGLKVFSLAYKDILIEEMANHNDESKEFRSLVEKDLTYLCTFGFEDTLRDGVTDSIMEIMTGTKV
jgi:magnesium-transporting ATPase (P-type)